jgi:hypothetical protein
LLAMERWGRRGFAMFYVFLSYLSKLCGLRFFDKRLDRPPIDTDFEPSRTALTRGL